jgi:hypothetical protein
VITRTIHLFRATCIRIIFFERCVRTVRSVQTNFIPLYCVGTSPDMAFANRTRVARQHPLERSTEGYFSFHAVHRSNATPGCAFVIRTQRIYLISVATQYRDLITLPRWPPFECYIRWGLHLYRGDSWESVTHQSLAASAAATKPEVGTLGLRSGYNTLPVDRNLIPRW